MTEVRTKTTAGRGLPLVLVLVLLIPAAAGAEMAFGIRGGAYIDQSDPFAGVELLIRMGESPFFFNPNFEYVFVEDGDLVTANLDVHYDFPKWGDKYIWAGVGAALIYSDHDGGDDDTDLGGNLIGGIGWDFGGFTPYFQGKVIIADDTELVAAAGVRF